MKQFARAIVLRGDSLLVMRREKASRKYCTLVGGAVDPGETPEQALYRELAEETGIEVANPRLVITQQGGGFGTQYIYLCEYIGGEPELAPDSVEAKINTPGQNSFQPGWLPLKDLPKENLLPVDLKKVLMDMLSNNFPQQSITITINTMESN